MDTVLVEIPVDEVTAAMLSDPEKRRSAGTMLRFMARPIEGEDPILPLLRRSQSETTDSPLTESEVAEELATWKRERAARSR